MELVNGIGRSVMQGGSRRSAIYASLHWQHGDVKDFLKMKNWNDMAAGDTTIGKLKEADFNFRAPMDFTNISVNYDTAWQTNTGTQVTWVRCSRRTSARPCRRQSRAFRSTT